MAKLSRFEGFRRRVMAIWDESLFRSEGEPKGIYKFVHFWVLVWRSFVRNRCPVRASALSFTTLLALIPVLAVVMSVSSMFLKSTGEKQIEEFIQEFVNRVIPQVRSAETNAQNEFAAVPDQDTVSPVDTSSATNSSANSETNSSIAPPASGVIDAIKEAKQAVSNSQTNQSSQMGDAGSETGANSTTNAPPPIKDTRVIAAQKEAAQWIHTFIQKTNSGALGVTGMFFVLLTVILTLTRIEEAFNDIWGVVCGREWLTRITNYVTAVVLGPALLGLALALASGPRFEKTRDLLEGMPFLEVLISSVVPYLVICLSFTLFYKLVPNTKVRFNAALVGGLLAGTLWQIYNHLGFLLASRVVSANKIYGGFALVPLFMGGLYTVWLTVLFGAQVAYAFQNREAYLQEKLVENVNQRGREFVALRLMTCIGQRYQRGLALATVPEMSKELGIPSRLIQQVLRVLLNARLVVEVSNAEPGYAPARPLGDITAHHILMAMRATQGQELVTRDEPVREEVYGEFARIQKAEKEAASQVSMLALVNRAQARLELAPAPPADDELKLTPALAPPANSIPIEAENKSELPAATPSIAEALSDPNIIDGPKPEAEANKSSIPEAETNEPIRRVVEPASDEERDFPL
jgi:membrane protein